MNTLTTTNILTHTPSAQNPDPTVATALAVALDVPDGGLDHRVDLAAIALRPIGERHAIVGSLHCVLHAGMSAALIAEHCHLPVEQVAGCTPVAVALTLLEQHLTAPPYLLITHQAAVLEMLIARHAGANAALGAAHLVDIAALARRGLGEPSPADLGALAARLGVATEPWPTRTVTDAALTGALYAHLHRIEHARAQTDHGAQPSRPLLDERTRHPQVSAITRPGPEVHRGQAA